MKTLVGIKHVPDTETKIKIGSDHSYAGSNDCSYVKQARKGIEVILTHGTDVFHRTIKANYPATLKGNGLHDNYGIVNFTRGRPKAIMTHWYREELWK